MRGSIPRSLPYNEELIEYLRAEKARGRRLVLATAADGAVARSVASHLGLFDEVIASDGAHNLKGENKAASLVERFGEKGFSYAGNARSDLAVWAHAKAAVIVNAPAAVADRVARTVPVEARFDRTRSRAKALLRALRPHQWVKNLLVFVPAITGAHGLREPGVWASAIAAFFAFSAVASAIYLINDLCDLSADRAHPRKRHRPFASGALQPPLGLATGAILLAFGAALGATCGLLPILGLYAVTSLAYSLWLKEQPLVDIFALATLYTLRLFAGGVATGYFVSLWLLGFSGFFFLSLAGLKRVEELRALAERGDTTAARRGDMAQDREILQTFRCCAAFVSALVLALYVQSETAVSMYATPGLIWGAVPLLLFWQCRLWLSTARGYMHDDPIVYAARDWVSWIVGAALVGLLVVARIV